MANTYTQVHIQFVFAVKFRNALIDSSWKEELHQYISGITTNKGHKLLVVNAMPDHLHLLVGFRPVQSISDFMQDIKGSSSKWINEKKFLRVRFEWQEGYGAFSYSKSQMPGVVNYIRKQEEHHRKVTFREEYLNFLKKFEVDYKEEYLFKDPQ